MVCGTASWWVKIAFFCCLIGTVLHIAGWATNFWLIFSLDPSTATFDMNVGLWWQRYCNIQTCVDSTTQESFLTDEFVAVRALETIAFCAAIFGTVMLLVYFCIIAVRTRCMAITLCVLLFFTGISSSIGTLVFILNVPDPYIIGYSHGLTVLGALLILIAAALMIPEIFAVEERDPYEGMMDARDVVPYDRNPTGRYTGAPRGSGSFSPGPNGLWG